MNPAKHGIRLVPPFPLPGVGLRMEDAPEHNGPIWYTVAIDRR